MKKNYLNGQKVVMAWFVICAFSSHISKSQTFEVTSKVNFNIASKIDTSEFFAEHIVYSTFKNTSPTKTIDSFFIWEKKVIKSPEEWKVTICDAQLCAGASIMSQMFYKGAGKSAKLDVGIFPIGVSGTAEIELLVYPENKKNLAKKYVYKATLELPTGTYAGANKLLSNKVYPNPTTGELFVDVKWANNEKLSMMLKDPNGRNIKYIEVNHSAAIQNIDLSNLNAGLYQLHYYIDGVFVKSVSIAKL